MVGVNFTDDSGTSTQITLPFEVGTDPVTIQATIQTQLDAYNAADQFIQTFQTDTVATINTNLLQANSISEEALSPDNLAS